MLSLSNFNDEDAKSVIARALRLLAIFALIAIPLVWWKLGWQNATLLAVGAAISAAGLWKWLRLVSAVLSQMNAIEGAKEGANKVHPMGPVLVGFFLTLGLMLAALYVSLKYLDGSVYALAAGLAMGVLTLTIEALRLLKMWTV